LRSWRKLCTPNEQAGRLPGVEHEFVTALWRVHTLRRAGALIDGRLRRDVRSDAQPEEAGESTLASKHLELERHGRRQKVGSNNGQPPVSIHMENKP